MSVVWHVLWIIWYAKSDGDIHYQIWPEESSIPVQIRSNFKIPSFSTKDVSVESRFVSELQICNSFRPMMIIRVQIPFKINVISLNPVPGIGETSGTFLRFSCAILKHLKTGANALRLFKSSHRAHFDKKYWPDKVRSSPQSRSNDPTSKKFTVAPLLQFLG